MKVGIVEKGGNLAKAFITALEAEIANVETEKKKALDLFDVLAFARKMSNYDQLVIIVKMNHEAKEENSAFFEGLAVLEAETGKNIFKAFYFEDEDGAGAVTEMTETFLNYLYHPEKLLEKEAEAPKTGEIEEDLFKF